MRALRKARVQSKPSSQALLIVHAFAFADNSISPLSALPTSREQFLGAKVRVPNFRKSKRGGIAFIYCVTSLMLPTLRWHRIARLLRGQAFHTSPQPCWQRHASSTHATDSKEYPQAPAVGIGVVILRKKNDSEEVGLSSQNCSAAPQIKHSLRIVFLCSR